MLTDRNIGKFEAENFERDLDNKFAAEDWDTGKLEVGDLDKNYGLGTDKL